MPNTQSWGRDHIDPSSPEFEALIRAHIGRPYANSVDKQAATWVQSPPLNLLGAYLRPTLTPDEFDLFTQKLARVGVDVNAAPDSVYAFGPRVQPMTWSHEFRHRAVQPEADETENRVLDAYYAGSRKAWKEAVDG